MMETYRKEYIRRGDIYYRNVERYLNDLPEMDITPVQETGIQQIGPVL